MRRLATWFRITLLLSLALALYAFPTSERNKPTVDTKLGWKMYLISQDTSFAKIRLNQIALESGWNPFATSHISRGVNANWTDTVRAVMNDEAAAGLSQFLYSTALDIEPQCVATLDTSNSFSIYNPKLSLNLHLEYNLFLRSMLNRRYTSLRMNPRLRERYVLAGYNCGIGRTLNALRYHGLEWWRARYGLPYATRYYVERILEE
jgi:hypothetical protein